MVNVRVEELRVDRWFQKKLPPTDERELEGLTADVKDRGVLVDLLVTNDGLLLDGHRRLEAAKRAGLARVPVKRLNLEGFENWEKAVAVAVNLFRRHLNEAQRANLGSSLLRIERVGARKRQLEGQRQGGKLGGRGQGRKLPGGDHPEAIRATEVVAKAVGVSRQTFERVEAVKKQDAGLAKRMLEGGISIAAAYQKVKALAVKESAEAETKGRASGLVRNLKKAAGQYRTVYMDPPWQYRDTGARGAAEKHYKTLTAAELAKLPVPQLAHPKGCHFWMWTTWPMIREGTPHELLRTWGLRWVGEFVWDKEALGVGHWFRSRTEVLILAVDQKKLRLLRDTVDPVVKARRGVHSRKPGVFYELLQELSPAPRIELFARRCRKGWDRWGLEA